MDILLNGIRDRRIAASDEYLDGSERRERALFQSYTRPWDPRETHSGRFIYGVGTQARLLSQTRTTRFDVLRLRPARSVHQITTIILHSTDGREFRSSDLPSASRDGVRRSYHRVDEIIANFVVFQDGTIVYTHDIENILNVAGASKGVDIEFSGRFPHSASVAPGARRLGHDAIIAGRRLVNYLKDTLPNIGYIHPHGQVERGETGGRGNGGKYDSCSGPDVWMNVGMWAVNNLGLICDTTDAGYPNHGISPLQNNSAYDQAIP